MSRANSLRRPHGHREATRAGNHLFVASLITLLSGLINLGMTPLLLLVLLMLTPIFYGVKTWVEVAGAGYCIDFGGNDGRVQDLPGCSSAISPERRLTMSS
jgi:hypothetical protein